MNESYTIEEVSRLLRVSKLTVYDLIKKEKLPAYRVGRQMRVDSSDLEMYKDKSKTGIGSAPRAIGIPKQAGKSPAKKQDIVISGQDAVLDILSKHVEKNINRVPLRSYTGSLNSLISMYNGECTIVSTHLYDGDTDTYNLPYVKRILSGHSFMLVNLVCRTAGFYVQKNNPKQIKTWDDLGRPDIILANREKGSGTRVLLDEQLRLNHIHARKINGYETELTSHFAVASAVSSLQADVGVGIENTAKLMNLEFIPLIKEQYDLVILKDTSYSQLDKIIHETINTKSFQDQLGQLSGYDLCMTGKILYES